MHHHRTGTLGEAQDVVFTMITDLTTVAAAELGHLVRAKCPA